MSGSRLFVRIAAAQPIAAPRMPSGGISSRSTHDHDGERGHRVGQRPRRPPGHVQQHVHHAAGGGEQHRAGQDPDHRSSGVVAVAEDRHHELGEDGADQVQRPGQQHDPGRRRPVHGAGRRAVVDGQQFGQPRLRGGGDRGVDQLADDQEPGGGGVDRGRGRDRSAPSPARCRAAAGRAATRLLTARGQVNVQNSRQGARTGVVGTGAAAGQPGEPPPGEQADTAHGQGVRAGEQRHRAARRRRGPPGRAAAAAGRPCRARRSGSIVACPRVAASSAVGQRRHRQQRRRARRPRSGWQRVSAIRRARRTSASRASRTAEVSSEAATTGMSATRWTARTRSGRARARAAGPRSRPARCRVPSRATISAIRNTEVSAKKTPACSCGSVRVIDDDEQDPGDRRDPPRRAG